MDVVVFIYAALLAGIILESTARVHHHGSLRQKRLFGSNPKYLIYVETGNEFKAGTDANVYLTITGTKGESQEKKLNNIFQNNFEAGKTDKFELELKDLGDITKIKIRKDNWGLDPKWLLNKIKIIGPAPEKKIYEFSCHCWLDEGKNSDELTPTNGMQAAIDCGGIFSSAAHCWQFDEAPSYVSPDLSGGVKAVLKDGAEIVESKTREKVASTLQKDGSWIDMGDFKGKCISDPTMCPNGITMIFWAKISKQDLGSPNSPYPKFILSSGGQDTKSRGFSVLHLHDKFVLKAVSDSQKWRMEIKDKIPLDNWFSFAFTWKKDRGLTYYINGVKEGVKPQPEDVLYHRNDFNDLSIGKPNSNNDANQILKMKFDQFVTWPRVLSDDEIAKAFQDGGGVPLVSNEPANTVSDPCSPSPCANQGACLVDKDKPEGYTCTCPSGYAGLQCEIKEDEVSPTVSTNAGIGSTSIADTTAGATTPAITSVPTTATATPGSVATTLPPTTVPGSTTLLPTTVPVGSSTPTTSGPTSPGPTNATTSSTGSTTPAVSPTSATTVSPTTAPGPKPDKKQVMRDLLRKLNEIRRLHKASFVSESKKISEEAAKWAEKLAADGFEQIDPNSTYGVLLCTHQGNDVVKACISNWYSKSKFHDWADPKLSVKTSPFTQMVWKNSSRVGVGVAESGNTVRRQNIGGGKFFVVVYFDPAQSEDQDIKLNVLPATGISEPAPYATCPEGYFKHPQGSRSCFAIRTTPKTWEDALTDCARDNGSLASVECREEADMIVNMLAKENETEAWLGMHDRLSEGRYIWVDGSPIPFSEWLPGEPDGNEDENCIVQAKLANSAGWADQNCTDKKAYVCRVPMPGYTTYKLTFQVTEPQSQNSFQNVMYPQSLYPGSYSMCTPAVQSTNDVIRDTMTRFFQAKNVSVQPVVNAISCLVNGTSKIEIILRVGPEVSQDVLQIFQDYIDENGGILNLSNGAKAKLISIDIVEPGTSYCPTQCASYCPTGCDPACCPPPTPSMQYGAVQSPPIQAPYPYPPATQYEPIAPRQNPWECPVACTDNVNYCPVYCSKRCCRRHLNIHRY